MVESPLQADGIPATRTATRTAPTLEVRLPAEKNGRGLGAVRRLRVEAHRGRADTGEPAHPRPEGVPVRVPRWTWAGASALCLLGAVLSMAYLSWSRTDARAEPSVEMFFPDPAHVGTWRDGRSLVFQFVVRNPTDQRQRYRYVVTTSGDGRPAQPVSSVPFDLGPQGTRRVWETLSPPPSRRVEVEVSLPGTGARIHFWTRSPSS